MTTTRWSDIATDGFFGRMSPEGWAEDEPFGSDRGWSKSPNNSPASGYSPPPPFLTGLPIAIPSVPRFEPHGALPPNAPMDTDVLAAVSDSASNSPVSIQAQTPPEMNASIDQLLDVGSGIWPQNGQTMDQGWELVSRQGSVISLDSPSENPSNSFGRANSQANSYYSLFSTENAMQMQQRNDGFMGNGFDFPLQQGVHANISPSPPDQAGMQLSDMSLSTSNGSILPLQTHFNSNPSQSLSPIRSSEAPPWNSQWLRDFQNMQAGSDRLVFAPATDLPFAGIYQNPGVQEQLRRSFSTSTNSISSEPSSSVAPGSPLDQFPGQFLSGQELSFPMHGNDSGSFLEVMPQTLLPDTSLHMSTASQLSYQNYFPDNNPIMSPTGENIPRTTLDISIEHFPETLLASTQAPALMNHFNQDSPMAIAPKASESPSMFGSTESAQQEAASNRTGGRQLGSHLAPEKRRDANTMREVGACWACALQRDKCGPGDPCHRCEKRRTKTNGPHPQLACDRTPLWDLLEFFLPPIMTELHNPQTLKDFVGQHTTGWTNVRIRLRLIPGRGLPAVPCEAYEFIPTSIEAQRQFQYFKNMKTGVSQRKEKLSPPLGMMQIEQEDLKRYSKYIDNIVELHFHAFAQMYCSDEEYDFQLRLLEHLRELKPEAKDEKLLLHEVRRLIVVTYIMGHTLVLEETNRSQVLPTLRHGRPAGEYGPFCSPRVVNRQLKYLFCGLHKQIMHEVYKRLQQMLKKSNQWPPAKWTAAFCAMLGLALVHEDTQKTIQLIMDYKMAAEGMSERQARANARSACEAIDVKFAFVMALFMRRSSKAENPICHRDGTYWTGKLDRNAVVFSENVRRLVSNHYSYLLQQHQVPADSQTNFTSRLVGRFVTALYEQS